MRSDTKEVDEIRARSRAVFGGAQYRIEVGAAIADGDGITCLTDLVGVLAGGLDPPPSQASVNAELKVLEAARLLTRAPRTRGERRVFLTREPSSYWAYCREVRDSAGI